ncbi:MAG: hypothetical protein HY738_04400, partial [Bacteroidia bacterium]|nr:hypothetical protein [Bacteroidia bacterium]
SSTELQRIDPKTGQKLDNPVTTDDLSNFNLYQFDYKVQKEKRTYYKLGDTGKILILLSDNEISKEYVKSK